MLFNGCPGVAQAYLHVLVEDGDKVSGNGHGSTNGHPKVSPFYPEDLARYYRLPRDFVALLLLPALTALMQAFSVFGPGERHKPQMYFLADVRTLLDHLVLWRNGFYSIDDPLPSWWLYHIYWPRLFINSLWIGKKWSRMNVSTTKMFELN